MTLLAHLKAEAVARRCVIALKDQGFDAKFAGGTVRDRLLGLVPKDFDIATTSTPEQTIKALRRAGFQAVPTGLAHGTITAVKEHISVEVTTLRRDVATDGRRAVVAFTDSFAEDAQRRDFTVNAMFEDLDGKVHDFVGGLDDLANKKLQFVGDPYVRVAEDYLRILRYARFQVQLCFDAPKLEFDLSLLSRISLERIRQETLLIAAPRVLHPQRAAIYARIAPILSWKYALNNRWLDHLLEWQDQSKMKNSFVPLAILYGSSAEKFLMTRNEKKLFSIWEQIVPASLGREKWFDILNLVEQLDCDVREFYEACHAKGQDLAMPPDDPIRTVPVPLNGHHLGLEPGPALGEALEKLRHSFWRREWQTPEEGLAKLSDL